MPELRGTQATPEIKAEWERAYALYREAPGDPHDKHNDRTERIGYVQKPIDFDELVRTMRQVRPGW